MGQIIDTAKPPISIRVIYLDFLLINFLFLEPFADFEFQDSGVNSNQPHICWAGVNPVEVPVVYYGGTCERLPLFKIYYLLPPLSE